MIHTILSIIVGVIIGAVITWLYFSNRYDGEIILDESDPYYATAGFNFNLGATEVTKRKYIIVRVKTQK